MKAKRGACSTSKSGGITPDLDPFWSESLDNLKEKLENETNQRERAQCMAHIQSHAVQLTLDLLVREPNADSFFRVLLKALLDQAESSACAAWLLNEEGTECDPWMSYVGDQFY